jgi:DNA (cytosine-5)-methyltransferase 1
MENVSGLRKGKMKLMFAEMTIALKQAGYRVSCRELNAWWYGVPQDRRRLIWVGVRDDLDMEPGHPAPTVKRAVSVREALEDLYGADVQGVKAKMRNPDFENKWKDGEGVGPTLMSSRPPTISIEGLEVVGPGFVKGQMRSLDEPSKTIAAIKPPSVTDGQTVRYLTIEESKTLQGFPEWFELNENEYKFVGNSVCPPMAEAVGNHLLNLLVTG